MRNSHNGRQTEPNQYFLLSVKAGDNIYFKWLCFNSRYKVMFIIHETNVIHSKLLLNYFNSGCISIVVAKLFL